MHVMYTQKYMNTRIHGIYSWIKDQSALQLEDLMTGLSI
jgi:hypothetical protein